MTVADAPLPPLEVTIPEQGSGGGNGEVGKQAPDKSPDQIASERAIARREAVEKAFAKGRAAAETRAKEGGKELVKAPSEERGKQAAPEAGKPEPVKPRPRGDFGRFAPAQPEEADPKEAISTPPPRRELPETAPYREPPPRFSEAAKADWHGAPDSVRAATTQAFQQYEQGIQQYRAAAQAFGEVQDYYQQARQDGTNLRTVLDNYVGMEQKLRGDLFSGLDLIVHNLNIHHPDGRKVTAYDVCAAYIQQSPEQRRMAQQGNYVQAQAAQLQQMRQEQQRIANSIHQMQYQQNFTQTRSAIDQFADSHPGFDERSDLIKQELEHGYPLPVAYERAMKLRPGNGTHAAQTRTTSAQTRDEIDRSISGAPTNGAAASYRTPKKSGSNREALANALRRARTGV